MVAVHEQDRDGRAAAEVEPVLELDRADRRGLAAEPAGGGQLLGRREGYPRRHLRVTLVWWGGDGEQGWARSWSQRRSCGRPLLRGRRRRSWPPPATSRARPA